MQQSQELGHDTFHLISNENLIAVQLYLVALYVQLILYLGEVKDTSQIEGIVNIEVNPEERFIGHGIELAIELLIVLVLQFAGLTCPEWFGIVDDIVLLGLYHLLLLFVPLALLAKSNGHRQEVAVLLQQTFNLVLLKELLAILADVHHDVCTATVLLHLLQSKFRATVARPFLSRLSLLIALSNDIHSVADHKAGIEAQSEMSDNLWSIVLVLVQEIIGTGKSNLVDILFYFIGGHTNTIVAHSYSLGILIYANSYLQLTQFTMKLTLTSQSLQFLCCIYGIAYNFTQKNLVIAIQELFNYGENVLCSNPNITLFHIVLYFFYSSNCLIVDFEQIVTYRSKSYHSIFVNSLWMLSQ